MTLADLLHIEPVSVEGDRVEALMPVRPELFQPHGRLHGGATVALLETVASIGAEQGSDLKSELPFGVEVHVRHRKGVERGVVRGVAELDGEETSARTGSRRQQWRVAAYDEAGEVVSDGVIVTKVVPLERLARTDPKQAGAWQGA